jgi:hypothetical protein
MQRWLSDIAPEYQATVIDNTNHAHTLQQDLDLVLMRDTLKQPIKANQADKMPLRSTYSIGLAFSATMMALLSMMFVKRWTHDVHACLPRKDYEIVTHDGTGGNAATNRSHSAKKCALYYSLLYQASFRYNHDLDTEGIHQSRSVLKYSRDEARPIPSKTNHRRSVHFPLD